jgi:hypothetical protein
VTLRFYTRGFGGRETLLAETVTGAGGGYRLADKLADAARLDVRAVGADGTEIPLAGAGVRLDPEQSVTLVAPADRLPAPEAELPRLMASLRPHLAGAALAGAREDDERRDLTLLHEATGWDARLIALAASAEQVAAATGVDVQAAYGMVRAGLPADPVQLARVSREGVGHALAKAVEARLVSLAPEQIAAAQDTLDAFGRRERRKLAMAGTPSSYGSMLAASGLTSSQQDRFDEIFSGHTGDAASLWQKAQEAGLPASQLRLTAQLGALTLNSHRLVESLRGEAGSPERLGPALVGGGFYQPAKWQERLRSLAGGSERVLDKMIPPAYEADTVEERLQAYAGDLAFKVRRSYPTEVIGDRVRSGELPLSGEPGVAQDVATILDRAAADGFRLGQQPLDRYLNERNGQLLAGISGERAQAATSGLRTLYRQYQITASDEGMVALQRAGLRSAFEVSGMPQPLFLARHGDQFPTRIEAALTWQRAQQVSAVTLNLVAATKQLDSFRLLPSLAVPAAVVQQQQEELVRQYPTMESLFGSLDFCECSHCRSVLSPAAYLVDLLKFLDDAPASPKNPYQALTERRPDLAHLALTCENTHTILPYIDIVNEILEFYLAHGQQLTAAVAYDTGDAASEDLIAEPQNLLPAAYDLLKQARYPLAAPFDLWLATVRAFTDHFEVPFWQLLEALRPSDELHPAGGPYGLAAVGYERLGLSPAELAILTDPSPLATWPALYGYPPGAAESQWGELAQARTLARKLGVSYHELVALLRTTFVNPDLGRESGNPLVLADPADADPCSWEQTRLRHADGTPATALDFVLLNHLVRVWRKLGWPLAETAQALVTFLPAAPDPRTGATLGPALATALLGLAHYQWLAELLAATQSDRRDLLALWGPLPDRRYAELFLTGTAQTRDPAFEGEPGSYLSAGDVLLADHREAVQAALRLTAEEISQILIDAGLDPQTAPLSMATVWLLYRYGLLARLLDVSVADLPVLKELSGLDPFTPLHPGPVTEADQDHPYRHTIGFVQTARAVADAGLSVADLDYLLRHRFDPVGPYRSAAQPPLALVRTLTTEIVRIRAEYAVPADPLSFTDEQLARSLGLVLPPEVVAAFLAAWTGPGTGLPDGVFEEHLHRREVPGVGEVGFLAATDLPVLFPAAPITDQQAEADRRARLAGALLPYLQDRLVGQAVVAAAAADLGADEDLVGALLTSPELIDDPDQPGVPLRDAYVAAGGPGLTRSDGEVTGYLEVPASGGYQVVARCAAAGTQVVLRFDHLSEPALVATSTDADLHPAATVELRAGVPYGFTLTHSPGAEVGLWLQGRQLPVTPVTRLITYPRSEVAALHRRHLLLAKVLRLAGVLDLSELELRHLLTHPDDFAGLDLSALPTTTGETTPAAARAAFAQVLRLVGYARLRAELAAEPADLIGVFRHARAGVPEGVAPAAAAEAVRDEVSARLAAIIRRTPETVGAAADLLGMTGTVDGGRVVASGFTQEQGLTRLWRVLSLATRLGVDPAALGRWATPSPDHAVARDVRATVKATYLPEQWRRVAQPIFDRLRRQRRDALVAQVLQLTGYQRMDQLFEHFLVDPGTEPVVQTSRLRLAISSVQTFVQRCLLNLEEEVAPSSINADYWEWMKRYRVWEANRKIFLWPENWLEPEFRDDKTHLFAELESALLESDLGEDAVEAALMGYLSGLEEIARLDVRAIYREEKPPPAGSVLHVLARTTTAPHKYFYRTWSRRSWTPWVPVVADIESDHVAMVFWRGRVHVFWVQLVPQAEASTGGASSGDKAADVTVGQIAGMRPRKKVDVLLYWSCLLQGAWSDPVLAEPDQPLTRTVSGTFDPRQVHMWADVLDGGTVSVSLLGQGIDQSFRIRSPYAPPTQSTSARVPLSPPYLTGSDERPLRRVGQGRWRGEKPKFAVHVEGYTITEQQGLTPCDITQDILAAVPGQYQLVIIPPPAKRFTTDKSGKRRLASDQPANRPDDPFFFVDESNTFFVEPDWVEFTIGASDQAVVAQTPVWHEFDRIEFWQARELVPAWPEVTRPGVVVGNILAERPVDVVIRPEAAVTLGGNVIGPAGGLADPGLLSRTGPHGSLLRPESSHDVLPGHTDLSPRS